MSCSDTDQGQVVYERSSWNLSFMEIKFLALFFFFSLGIQAAS